MFSQQDGVAKNNTRTDPKIQYKTCWYIIFNLQLLDTKVSEKLQWRVSIIAKQRPKIADAEVP